MAGPVIQPLSPEVRSYLRTGVALCSITQCMEELVLNSVDAGATCIAVRIDLSCFKIQVVDNGTGMTQSQLELIGQRYHTSKCHTMEDLDQLCHYGYRGEAIASLKDACSILEITSRTKYSTPTFSKIFNKGVSMKVVQSSVQRPSAGTTVTAHDLFYNMPVRKKAMNPVLEFERVKKRLEGIALMRPVISFSLRNDITGHVVLQTHKTNGVLNVFTSLFGIGRSKTLSPVEGHSGCFSVDGYIGKEGFSKKDLQFVYINKRLVLKTKIHKVINFLLGKSLILRKKGAIDKQGESKQQESISSLTSSPTKYSEKFGVFVVNVTCPYTEYDVTFDPAKTLVEFKDWDLLCTCIEGAVSEFLKRECLLLGIQEMMAEERLTSGEKSGDTIETSTNEGPFSTSENSSVCEEQISTSNNRNFLTSKLVKRQVKHVCDQTKEVDHEDSERLDTMETKENVTYTETVENNCDGKFTQNKESVRSSECRIDQRVSNTSETVSSSGHASEDVGDHSILSSTDSLRSMFRGRKKCSDIECSDSDDKESEVTDKFDEDGDYESEEPVPIFDRNFKDKGKELTDLDNEPRSIIRLETPYLGCNGGSTLSLIRKQHKSNEEGMSGELSSSHKIHCKSLKKRLQCDKTSDINYTIKQHNQMDPQAKTSELLINDIYDLRQTKEVVTQREQRKQNNCRPNAAVPNKNGGSDIGHGGSSSHGDANTFTSSLPQKRISTSGEASVAAKLARMTRIRLQQQKSRALGSELGDQCSTSSSYHLRDVVTKTSRDRVVFSSEGRQEMVASKISQSGNQYNSFENSCSDILLNRVPKRKSIETTDSFSKLKSSDSTRNMIDLPAAPKKFLTTASFVQTYDDVIQNCKVSRSLSHQYSSDHNACGSDTFTMELSNPKLKTTTTIDHSETLSDKSTDLGTCLGSKTDTVDSSMNTGVGHLINDEKHFHGASSESEADNIKETVLFEGTPKFVSKLDLDRWDTNSQDSNTDLLCYEVFDYSQTLLSKEKSSNVTNIQKICQPHAIDNSQHCQQDQLVSLGNEEGNSILTMQGTDRFDPCLSSPEISNRVMTTQGSDIPQSQGFVPLSDMSAVIDKQVFIEPVQESQGFVPIPAFTENRVISPAVSEGFSPVMMDDVGNTKTDKNSSNQRSSKDICEDCNINTDYTSPSTDEGVETKAEYLNYYSSIAELYEDDMSYVKKKKKMLRNSRSSQGTSINMESSEPPKPPVIETISDDNLNISTEKSQKNLSEDSFPTQQTNEIFKTQVRSRKCEDSSMSDQSDDPIISSQLHDLCQNYNSDNRTASFQNIEGKDTGTVGNDGEKKTGFVGNDGEKKTGFVGNDGEKKTGFFGNDGEKKTGFVGNDGEKKTFSVGNDGEKKTGFVEIDGEKKTGFVGIDGGKKTGFVENGKEDADSVGSGEVNDTISTGNKELSNMLDTTTLTCDREQKSTECTGYGQQSLCQLDETDFISRNVVCDIMSNEEEGHIYDQCESLQSGLKDSPERDEGQTEGFDSTTEITYIIPDTGNSQVSCLKKESFHNDHRVENADESIATSNKCSSHCSLNMVDLGNGHFENKSDTSLYCKSSSDRSEELDVPGLSSKQLQVLQTSNRKGKLPRNIVNICDKHAVIPKTCSTDISAGTHQWSDVDEGELLAVTVSEQTCCQLSQESPTNKAVEHNYSGDEQPWMEMEDPKTGEKLYVNRMTGHTRPRDGSWEPPTPDMKKTNSRLTASVANSEVDELSPQSHNTLLNMMSEHLGTLDKEEEELLSVKWAGTRCYSEGMEDNQNTDMINSTCVEDLLENWNNPVFTRPEQEIAAAVETSRRTRGSARVQSVLHSHKFTKDMIQDIKVIGQVDKKFIACMTSCKRNNIATAPNLMLLFDQHAAHERVRLEKLTKDAYERDNRICRSTVTPAKHLTLEEEEVRVMVSYKEEFYRIGVEFSTDKQERDCIFVHTIPACIMQKEVNEVKRKRASIAWNVVLNMLKEHVEMLIGTNGVLGRLPTTLHKVLCSQACHGAIKFGDQLSLEECEELLHSLAKCDLPFQCAHGRPSIMPLLELDKLQPSPKTTKPNLWKISKHLQTS
ncbi:serine-rich adhesin for platelets-like [Ylistrum balloti]|uniref:serine-rich adhesin for platelets-like n=1 Tax=Ylistrum balloti TaxID=509963 RepID=UPI002905EA4E|nr:serine-rich adhesin for platelets-like [Ylistrum balloti]